MAKVSLASQQGIAKLCERINDNVVSQLVWMLFAPLTVTVIAIILISPMTAKWCLKQTVPGLEAIFNEFAEKFQTVLSRVRG